MSNCCPSNNETTQRPKRHVCPNNNRQYLEVPYSTVIHHVKAPWKLALKQQAYYFCDDPNCDVVYFGYDETTINKQQLRTKVGIKEQSDETLLCYCFGVSKSDAMTDSRAKAFVVEQTKTDQCACTTYNPSGRCCLKDFPKEK